MEAEWESECHLSGRNPIHCYLTCLEEGYDHMNVRSDHLDSLSTEPVGKPTIIVLLRHFKTTNIYLFIYFKLPIFKKSNRIE